MKNGNESAVATATDNERNLAFLEYLSEFLLQFTKKAESLNLYQIAYFLSMAAAEVLDTTNRISASAEYVTSMNALKKAV